MIRINSFNCILGGSSTYRSELTKELTRNEVIEEEICRFIHEDMNSMYNDIGPKVTKIYSEATAWKKRAEGIIHTLRIYGNAFVGEAVASVKVPAMVDRERLVDLINEYDDVNVHMGDVYSLLQSVYEQSTLWSENIAIERENDLLTLLTTCHNNRPKGINLNPAQDVFDLILELLVWHNKIKCAISKLRSMDGKVDNDLFPEIYMLVIEGIEVIQQYSKQWDFGDLSISLSKITDYVVGTGQSLNPTKHFSLSKIEVTQIGKKVCDRITSVDFDLNVGHPLFCMIYVLWAFDIKTFLSRVTGDDANMRPTLQEAIALAITEPKDHRIDFPDILVNCSLKKDISRFNQLIIEGKKTEEKAKSLCISSQDSSSSSSEKTDEIRDYEASLKEVLTRMKSPKQGEEGLILDPSIGKDVDQRWKDSSWLVRTLTYPLLHDDDVEVTIENRLTWDILVSLFEQIPSIDSKTVGNLQQVILRVQDLHLAANMWQEEVSSVLSIPTSERGKESDRENQEPEHTVRPKLSFMQLANILKDPILLKIAMPREVAAREVLEKAKKFEQLLYNLLGTDYNHISTDKAPYPDTKSMVGEDGRFYLYRLTESLPFETLKVSVEELVHLCSEIAADTLGEKVFEWIRQCVKWIQSVHDAVGEQAPFGGTARIFLQTKDATDILSNGNQIL